MDWHTCSFYVLSVMILGSALMVVSLRNIVHCALFLAFTFMGVAGVFALLHAEFLAAVQVLIYVGAITVLILFAVMLTQKTIGISLKQTNRLAPLAVLSAVTFLCMIAVIALNTTFPTSGQHTVAVSTQTLGRAILGNGSYVVPFEVASILLLAAMVGAIVIARGQDN